MRGEGGGGRFTFLPFPALDLDGRGLHGHCNISRFRGLLIALLSVVS